MAEKLSYKVVYKTFKDEGCELLETEYINNHTKMKYICGCGNESEITYNKFQQNRRCSKCGGNEKHKFEAVYKFFEDEGCELLETKYINSWTKMKYLCSCGNKSKIKFNNFKKGSKCLQCSGKEKHKFEAVYKHFKDEGCELLETEYINNKTPMKFKCSCENESVIRYNSFKRDGRCIKCSGKEKHNFEDIYKLFKDKGCELLETEYINNSTKMKYICNCGNESTITLNKFKNNQRCRECWLEKKFGKTNPNYKPDRTRPSRTEYLSFNNNNLHFLKDDPNYINHIQSKKAAKASGNRWDRSDYTVDHIFPRVAFVDNDLDNIYGQRLIKEICNLRENLRIIHGKENRKKSGKYNQEEFMNWFNEKLTVYHNI